MPPRPPIELRAPLTTWEAILDKMKWIYDPPPEWIIRDPGRFQEYLQFAVDFRAREIDLEIQTLALEKERIQAGVKLFQK